MQEPVWEVDWMRPFSLRPTAPKRCTAGSKPCPGPSWRSVGLAGRRLLYVSCAPCCPPVPHPGRLPLPDPLVSFRWDVSAWWPHTNGTCRESCISNAVLPVVYGHGAPCAVPSHRHTGTRGALPALCEVLAGRSGFGTTGQVLVQVGPGHGRPFGHCAQLPERSARVCGLACAETIARQEPHALMACRQGFGSRAFRVSARECEQLPLFTILITFW